MCCESCGLVSSPGITTISPHQGLSVQRDSQPVSVSHLLVVSAQSGQSLSQTLHFGKIYVGFEKMGKKEKITFKMLVKDMRI